MARARNIKPGFFKNEVLAEMPFEARLLFIGLWTLADREGRMEDRPKRIRAEIFPLEFIDADPLLERLAQDGFIVRYAVDGAKFIQIENFTKHQMPHHKEVASVIPAPEGCPQITRHAYDVSAQQRLEVFRRDGDQCLRCGSTERLSLDHIIPLACGGDNSITNLQTLCTSCNSSKGDTTKDYRKAKVEPTLSQRQANDEASCPPDSLSLDSLIPDSLIPDPLQEPCAPSAHAPAADDLFAKFWKLYPRKQDKAKALKAFAKLKVTDDLFNLIAKGLAAQAASHDWLKDGGKFVPMPTTWLNGKRWEDEVKPAGNVHTFPGLSRHTGLAERFVIEDQREDGTHAF